MDRALQEFHVRIDAPCRRAGLVKGYRDRGELLDYSRKYTG